MKSIFRGKIFDGFTKAKNEETEKLQKSISIKAKMSTPPTTRPLIQSWEPADEIRIQELTYEPGKAFTQAHIDIFNKLPPAIREAIITQKALEWYDDETSTIDAPWSTELGKLSAKFRDINGIDHPSVQAYYKRPSVKELYEGHVNDLAEKALLNPKDTEK